MFLVFKRNEYGYTCVRTSITMSWTTRFIGIVHNIHTALYMENDDMYLTKMNDGS